MPATDAGSTARDAALRALVGRQFDFVWRSLRRLGVREADLDDATQQVFLVVNRKLSQIEPDKERSFVFQVALRIASDARRTVRRRREVGEAALPERIDSAPLPDEDADRERMRAVLDAVLEDMPIELRAVLLLFELEELSSMEIGELLGIPTGTVASRLRRARVDFQARVAALEATRGALP
jgi:RNA polymerase sigma-70 factor (ECF subfamily)